MTDIIASLLTFLRSIRPVDHAPAVRLATAAAHVSARRALVRQARDRRQGGALLHLDDFR